MSTVYNSLTKYSASVMVRKFVHEDIVILIMQSVTTFGSSEHVNPNTIATLTH